ncbi:DUF4199 domain-containing protein [Reichenbachiella versicolor]|uniref:DUF4199 domain-containing protein n=1 Tax=Reichenbachiella versicolor TaxID=1821036 RepID=UPI000D6E12B5|nr:DUF4199 domain-containing protein [Reichenbachiella versicolor]
MNSLFNTSIKFGLIGSGIYMFIFMIYYFSGANPLVEMYIINIFILPIFLYFGIREFRDYRNGSLLSFGQGMSLGVILYVLIATLTSAFTFVFLEFIDSSLVENFIQVRIDDLVSNKDKTVEELGQEMFNEQVMKIENNDAKDLVLDSFLKRVLLGFFLTTVISLVMKKTER